jgi:signal transduction histidine kinase
MELITRSARPRNSILLAAAATGSTIRIPDVRERTLALEEFAPVHDLVAAAPWNGVVATPLMYRGRVIGAIGTYYPDGQMPAEPELGFVQALADQAAIGVENANLFAEATRRTQELEALYRADEELHRSLQLDTVLQSIVDAAVDLLGADAASVAIWDEQTEQPRVRIAGSTLDTPPEEMAAAAGARDPAELDRLVFRVVEDTQDEPDDLRERAERFGIASYIEVPVVVQGETVGLFSAAFERSHAFSSSEQRLFQALAQRAALAIENAKLFAQTERRRRQLDALYRADEALHRSLRLEEVVQALNDVAVEVLEADRSLFVSWPEGAPAPITWSASGITEEMFEALSESFRRDSTPEGFRFREPYLIEDSSEVRGIARARMELADVKAVVELPIVTGDSVFGIFFFGFTQRQKFSAEDRRLFQALAQRAAVAIENAQLYEQAQNLAAVEERQRLARELHDSVSQALYGIALGARTARTLLDRDPARATEPMDYVLSLAEAGLAEMRALIFELRPESLANEGIVRAIEKHVASLQARYGVRVHADLASEPEVPLTVKEALYRIMQEALHNTVKHARAQNVHIALRDLPHAVELDLRDDGAGFDTTVEYPGQLGLKSMRERALRLGGEFEIESSPESGTHVCARIPK